MSLELLNLNKQSSQSCVYCGKSYKNTKSLNKHSILCELYYNSKKRNSEEDEIQVPSQRKLYLMLLEIGDKFNKLEEKVNEINKLVIKKKKKINIIQWLNNNITPEINFNQLLEKIKIYDTDVAYLFENSFMDTLNNIFSKYVYNLLENENPIFAFIQKSNTFYVYENEQIKWVELSKENLIKFLNKVYMKIQVVFYNWKKNKITEIQSNENLSIKCDKTTIKIMEISFTHDNTLSKIKTIMYTKMKTDMKAIIEYEFEF
jgi:hypothetical protein